MLMKNHLITAFEEMMVNDDPVRIRIEHRTDPFFPLHTTIISDKRADKPGKPSEKKERNVEKDRIEKEKCYFEPANIHQTPKPREYHPELEIDGYIPVSVPNKYGFSVLGRVNCFTSHERKYLELMTPQDWSNYLHISAKNANHIISKGYSEMFSVVNSGRIAGSSQAHPHSQDGVLESNPSSLQSRKRDLFFRLQQIDDHPFDTYMGFLRKQDLECFENDSAFISASYAPIVPDQIDILLKKDISSFVQLGREEVRDISKCLHHAVHFLSTERGVSDLNLVSYQDALIDGSGYRLNFQLSPRNKNVLGSIEVGYNQFVVDTWPEATAEAFRKYMERVPEEER